jgi:hypothetical protein
LNSRTSATFTLKSASTARLDLDLVRLHVDFERDDVADLPLPVLFSVTSGRRMIRWLEIHRQDLRQLLAAPLP